MDPAGAGAIAAAIAVPIALALFAQLFPFRAPVDGPTLAELSPRYGRWETRLGLAYIFLSAICTYPLWLVLKALAAFHARLLPEAHFKLTAMSLYWLIPAMFLAMIAAVGPLTAVSRWLFGDRYREYQRYSALKYGFDERKVARILVSSIGTACAVLIFLGLDWYVLINSESLIINRYLSLGATHYRISDVREIRTAPQLIAPNGNTVHRREYLMILADGSKWSTNDSPQDLDDEQKKALMTYIARNAHVEISEVRVFERGDL